MVKTYIKGQWYVGRGTSNYPLKMVAWPVANAQSKVTGRLPGSGHSLAMSWGGL